jgi:hypothetical protein
MTLKDPKMSKQGASGIRKHVYLMIPQKLEITKSFESGKSRCVVQAAYNIEPSTIYDTNQ